MTSETRFAVRRGTPTAEELAALVVALDGARRADEAARRRPRRPAWQRAARLESVRGRLVAAPADLR